MACSRRKDLISLHPWPSFDPLLAQTEKINLAVQINGKVRSVIHISKTADEETALAQAQQEEKISKILSSATIKKIIYKPGRILNIVCK